MAYCRGTVKNILSSAENNLYFMWWQDDMYRGCKSVIKCCFAYIRRNHHENHATEVTHRSKLFFHFLDERSDRFILTID